MDRVSAGEDGRWEANARQEPRWDDRTRLVAAFIPAGSSVLDLGSGAQTLRAHLPPGGSYQPCDIVPGPDVVLCDLDNGVWPHLATRFDVAVCAGVLEYMGDVASVLSRLPEVCDRALVTYADRKHGQRLGTRTAQGWVSHLTLAELMRAVDCSSGRGHLLAEWRGHVIASIDFKDGLPPLRDGGDVAEDPVWEASFQALRAYVERGGEAAPRASLVYQGVALGAWVRAQRRMRRRRTLTDGRAARLQELPGWAWVSPPQRRSPRSAAGRRAAKWW